MQSSNPVFRRADGFNGRTAQGNPTYPGNGQSYDAYGSPATWGTGAGTPTTHTDPAVDRGPMTIDSVVQKTALTLGVVVVVAALTWVTTGDLSSQQSLSTLYVLSMVGALGGFVLSMVNSFRRVISPALVLAYAALEGLFVGAFSKT
ncbi:MAG: Bax inhibitor-1/YccA family protein, partial [Marmoricola sp.]|nr:Bax inhibitor-1/YccA family protein [Marmoricola sp.]